MTPRYNLLPRGKSDHEAVERLRQLPKEELLPLLPHLAEWLEDSNWPVARPVWALLLPYVAELEPFIVEVLLYNDDIWKYNLLSLISWSTLPILSGPLREQVERIAHSPTSSERDNDTAEAARDLLNKYATHLLPRNKFDDGAVERLTLLPEAELLPLLPDVAMWIQDWNWPIAPAVEKLLKQHVAALVPTILEVLAGNDEQWQWNLLYLINPTTLSTLPASLRTVVEGMAVYPTTGEYDMYLVWQARYVLGLYDAHPLLPQTKTDYEAVERLSQLPKAELLPLLPKLAEWLEDTNWPVSRPVWIFLLPYVAELEPFIIEVLLGNDDIWKCNLLRLVECSSLPALSPRLRELTERIAYSPPFGGRANNTAEAAQELLAKYAAHLLPQSKDDEGAIAQLALLPKADLLPLLPGLTEWIQDGNWPIAPAVAKLLEQHVAALEPTILKVLAGNDEQWQSHLLHLVRPETLPALSPRLRTEVECIAASPMYGEYATRTVEAARDLLNRYGYRRLLPQHKGDDAAVARLRQLPEAELLPLLPKLMEWLQDLNWPVAGPVLDFLEPRVAVLEPAIVEVLMGNDAAWKRNLIKLVEYSAVPALSPRLRELIERIARSPDPGEQAEETDEAARNLLARYATHLLPQHKGDEAAVERLQQLPETELLPLLPELLPRLLGCLLDGNWPIAKGVRDLLAAHLHQLAPAVWEPELLEALTGTDDIWKGHLLYMLSQAALTELPPTVRQIIERIAHTPTPSEREYDTDEAARNLLARYA